MTISVAWIAARCSQSDQYCWSEGHATGMPPFGVGHSALSTHTHVFSDGQLFACKCSYTEKSPSSCGFSLVTYPASSATIMSCHYGCNLARLY